MVCVCGNHWLIVYMPKFIWHNLYAKIPLEVSWIDGGVSCGRGVSWIDGTWCFPNNTGLCAHSVLSPDSCLSFCLEVGYQMSWKDYTKSTASIICNLSYKWNVLFLLASQPTVPRADQAAKVVPEAALAFCPLHSPPSLLRKGSSGDGEENLPLLTQWHYPMSQVGQSWPRDLSYSI